MKNKLRLMFDEQELIIQSISQINVDSSDNSFHLLSICHICLILTHVK